jgi:hypothetical protein
MVLAQGEAEAMSGLPADVKDGNGSWVPTVIIIAALLAVLCHVFGLAP